MELSVYRSPLGCASSILSMKIGHHSLRMMIDCGTRFEEKSEQYLADIRSAAPHIDAILLSSSSIAHCGALPYIVDLIPQHCAIYASLPTAKLSKITCTEYLLGTNFAPALEICAHGQLEPTKKQMSPSEKTFANMYTLEDIEKVFSCARMRILYWGERASLHAQECSSVQAEVQAYPSGDTLGGTIWRIKCVQSGQSIIHSKKLGSLNGDFLRCKVRKDLFTHANVFVTEPLQLLTYTPLESVLRLPTPSSHEPGYSDGHGYFNKLLEKIIEILFIKKGTAIIPTDAGERMTAILSLVNTMWGLTGFEEYPLVVLSHTAKSYLSTVKCLTNFASDGVQSAIYEGRENAFDSMRIPNALAIESMSEFSERVEQAMPKLIIVTPSCMQYGLSQEILFRYAHDPLSTFVIDGPPVVGSVTHQLLQAPVQSTYIASADTQRSYKKVRSIHFYMKRRLMADSLTQSVKVDNRQLNMQVDEAHPDLTEDCEKIDNVQHLESEISPLHDAFPAKDSSSFQSTLQPGVYGLDALSLENKLPLDIADSEGTVYGELIRPSLLKAWDVDQRRYYASVPLGSEDNVASPSPGEQSSTASKSSSSESLAKRYSDQFTFGASSYESFKIALKVHAEVAYVDLVNSMSPTDFAQVLDTLNKKFTKCCVLGKIPMQLKDDFNDTILNSPATVECTSPCTTIALDGFPRPQMSIDGNFFQAGRHFSFPRSLWSLTAIQGVLDYPAKTDEGSSGHDRHKCALKSLSNASMLPPVGQTLIGDSSLDAIKRSLKSVHIHTNVEKNVLLANDMCLMECQSANVRVESIASSDALDVHDALLAHYIEV